MIDKVGLYLREEEALRGREQASRSGSPAFETSQSIRPCAYMHACKLQTLCSWNMQKDM